MAEPVFTSKADVAYALIRQRILDGTLAAGSPLAQYELAADLGISITPLREAVRRLSGEGWVLLDTHRNARVAGLDLAGARQLLEARRALEPAAVALAAERRTDDDVAQMQAALGRLRPVTRRWGEAALAAHREVHRTLYGASHNEVMVRMLDDLWDKSDRYRRVGLQLPPGGEERTRDFEEHHELVRLVVDREADAAAALMASHVDHSLAAAVLAAEEAEGESEAVAVP
ncbi:transcriptional regulator [Nocardioides flavus (ex Wang et al. 2016)]|uniref:Transcriptional regulator n=1 Tax=Nocardioides flavus (ex Wang et al. 2016) TaxID=2058780 RepID=A0ABQ3HI21_9ACTN|nr:GntR family transcriptional regulator [Nocardioides flavus (ex Wang et al. 2016)]GHE15028.1 transcriptional regulator [Nocardioides flavus (ex Wang et al. 2016)]